MAWIIRTFELVFVAIYFVIATFTGKVLISVEKWNLDERLLARLYGIHFIFKCKSLQLPEHSDPNYPLKQ